MKKKAKNVAKATKPKSQDMWSINVRMPKEEGDTISTFAELITATFGDECTSINIASYKDSGYEY